MLWASLGNRAGGGGIRKGVAEVIEGGGDRAIALLLGGIAQTRSHPQVKLHLQKLVRIAVGLGGCVFNRGARRPIRTIKLLKQTHNLLLHRHEVRIGGGGLGAGDRRLGWERRSGAIARKGNTGQDPNPPRPQEHPNNPHPPTHDPPNATRGTGAGGGERRSGHTALVWPLV